jgi:hypothetical protein
VSKGTHTTWAPPPPVTVSDGRSAPGGPGNGAQPTEIRAQRALELLSAGNTYRQVAAELVRQFGISMRTAERDLARAQQVLVQEHKAERPALRAKLETRLWRLSKVAEEDGQYGAAIRALYVIGRFNGIDQVQVAAAADPETEEVLRMTGVEREKRIAELVEKRTKGAQAAHAVSEPEAPQRPAPFDPTDRARGRR